MPPERLDTLVSHLLGRPERSWVEFKHNNCDPDRIGRYVSALSNAAALADEPYGYLLWGVEDGTGEVVGTTFDPIAAKKGNQSLQL